MIPSTSIRWLTLFFLTLLASSGCVRRRLIVRTTPPGATVYVDKQPIGTSPISTPFTYYGTREIEVVGDGFRTEKVFRKINPPWYQLPGLDFVSESLWPWEIRDERIIDISLVPSQPPPSEVLQARADALRIQAAQGIATPLPPTVPANADFRNETLIGPGSPARPLDPTFQGSPLGPATTAPPIPPSDMTGNSGGILGNFLAPGGQPPTRIPEAGILPGGSYRPDVDRQP